MEFRHRSAAVVGGVPSLPVLSMGRQVCARLEVRVVVIGVEVYDLHIPGENHRGVGRRKATVRVVDVLGDLPQARDELIAVRIDAGLDPGSILPRARSRGVVSAAGEALIDTYGTQVSAGTNSEEHYYRFGAADGSEVCFYFGEDAPDDNDEIVEISTECLPGVGAGPSE